MLISNTVVMRKWVSLFIWAYIRVVPIVTRGTHHHVMIPQTDAAAPHVDVPSGTSAGKKAPPRFFVAIRNLRSRWAGNSADGGLFVWREHPWMATERYTRTTRSLSFSATSILHLFPSSLSPLPPFNCRLRYAHKQRLRPFSRLQDITDPHSQASSLQRSSSASEHFTRGATTSLYHPSKKYTIKYRQDGQVSCFSRLQHGDVMAVLYRSVRTKRSMRCGRGGNAARHSPG
jgi:hypothetical protein